MSDWLPVLIGWGLAILACIFGRILAEFSPVVQAIRYRNVRRHSD